MKCLRHLFLPFVVLAFSFQLKAQDTAGISNVFVPEISEPVQPLQNYLRILEDKNGKLQIDDFIQNRITDTAFHKAVTLEGFDPYSTWWCTVTFQPSFSSGDFFVGVLFVATSGLSNGNDIADVWITKNNQVVHQYRTGNLNPVSQRPVSSPINQNLFPVSFKKGEALSIYWRIQRTKYFLPPQLNFTLQHKSFVTPSPHNTPNNFTGNIALLYLGVMSILFFFGLVFFLITRQKTFTWFTLTAACMGLHILLLHPANYLTTWFFGEHPVLQFHAFFWLTALLNISVLMLIRAFVETRKFLPVWNKIILGLVIFIAVTTFMRSLLLQVDARHDVPFIVTVILFISSLIIGLRLVFTKILYARWMGGALLWLFSFQLLGLAWNMELLPDWFFNPWIISQVGMMIIIFFALAYRFKQSAKDKAEAEKVLEMDKIKSRFFANISHEFRTPLTLIQGPLQQIEEAIPTGQKQTGSVNVPWRQVKTMRRHTDRLLELVNQLLDLSKLDSGKMKLQVIRGDVLQMLKVFTASFESMAERKGIHFYTHFPEQTIIAFFDKDKLDKIFCNLLGNAFKYTPEQGTVSVIIETEEGRLRISVEDSGSGIPKKELDKVFDRFYQVEGNEDKGSGIGLALVKELVDLYRGQISVSSEPGKGSRFRVSLPVEKSGFKENEIVYGEWKEDQRPFMSIEAEEEILMGNVSGPVNQELPLLLVVEDNTDLRQYIIESVHTQYNIIEASNGKAGLEKAMAEVPDIIISDVMMPLMDGFTMTEKLKNDERTSHIPVILLTAKAGQQQKIEGLKTGADEYLLKPFDCKELLTRLQNLLNQRKLLRKKFAGTILLKPSEVSIKSADDIFLKRIMTAIEMNMKEDDFGVEELSKEVAMSRSQLHRKLVALTGQSPSEILRHTRLLRAKELLEKRAAIPSEVAYMVGFNSHTYFSKCFKEEFGISPGEV